MNEAVREMTFEEEYKILNEEKKKLFDREIEGCEPPFANCVVRRALRCIRKLMKEKDEELQQYRSIGTIEECREAAERQRAKKPIMKPYFDDMEEEYLCCPTCGDILTDRIPSKNEDFYFHCLNCGQRFLWERDNE